MFTIYCRNRGECIGLFESRVIADAANECMLTHLRCDCDDTEHEITPIQTKFELNESSKRFLLTELVGADSVNDLVKMLGLSSV